MKKLLVSICLMSFVIGFVAVSYAAPIQWTIASGGNDHWYEGFDTLMSWDDAKAYAESLGGYLATIASQNENDFLWNNFVLNQGLTNPWLGGFQPTGTSEPDSGWQWVTGEAWIYTNWGPGQPDDAHGGQDYLVFYTGGTWDDYDFPGGVTCDFIVEYDTNPVPIPSAIWLLGSGLIGLAGLRRKLKIE